MTVERGGSRKVRLMETFRTVFYTPIYVAVAGGFLESEGLDVDFQTCPGGFPHPLSALKHGAADIVQSGIMRCIIALDWGAETTPLHFAKINARDGFFVLSREEMPQFRWETLAGSRVIPVGFSPMPWASFQYTLRNNGVDPAGLTLLHGLSLEDAVAAFRAGEADFIHLPEPAAEQLIAAGYGYLAAALGPENGHVAYSSFAATRDFIAKEGETLLRFTTGFGKGLAWLGDAAETEVAQAIGPFFPDTPPDLLAQSVGRYRSQGTWPETPALEPPEYEGLQEILVAAGLVRERQPYEKVVCREFFGG